MENKNTPQIKVDEIRLLQRKAFAPIDENLWNQLVPWLLQRQEIAKAILSAKEDRDSMYHALRANEDAIKELLQLDSKPQLS